jgi:hypothetical protein
MAKTTSDVFLKLLLDPLWVEKQTALSFAELDSFGAGAGTTRQKLEASRKGFEVSVRNGKCLVRNQPERLNCATQEEGSDITTLSMNCAKHQVQHKWYFQRGYLEACLLGRFDVPLIDLLCSHYEASHVCHNGPCSDPFHIENELHNVNLSREPCHKKRRHCIHAIRCWVELIWDYAKGWKQTLADCVAARHDLVKPGWVCSEQCTQAADSKVFRGMLHWRNGCP